MGDRLIHGSINFGCNHVRDVCCVICSDRGEERDDKRRSRGGCGLRSGCRMGVQPWGQAARHTSSDDRGLARGNRFAYELI